MVLWIAACAHRPPDLHPPAAPSPEVAAPRAPSAEARAFYLRAERADRLGDAAEAERAAAWLTRLDGDSWAWVRASDLARRGGRLEQARSAADRALAVDPELPEAHRVAGLAAVAAGDPARAIPHLDEARGLPEVDAARVLAVRDSGGDPVAALQAWSPTTASARLERARVALAVGRPDDALSDALSLLEHPAYGPEALRVAVGTCRLAAVEAALARLAELTADPRWAAPLRELALAPPTCAERR